MRFEPKTEDEINAANLLEGGEYDFEITSAEDTQSQKGNDMVALKLSIEDSEGRKRTVFDYLVATDGSAYKLHAFAKSVGLLPDYERGEMLAESMVNRAGRCQIGIDDKNKAYPAKNVVRNYLPASDAAAPVVKTNGKAQASGSVVDDDIPF